MNSPDTVLRDEIRARTLEDGRDVIDEQMRAGMHELARRDELPDYCDCYAIVDSATGILHPHYCDAHRKIAMAERIRFGYVKYERAFLIEAEARDRAHIVKFLYKRDDTLVEVVQIGRYWVVLARWGFTVTGGWGRP